MRVYFFGGGHLQPCGWDPLICATSRGVWISPYCLIWGYVLHVEHISCVFTNGGQHQLVILFLFSIFLAGGKHNQKIPLLAWFIFKILLILYNLSTPDTLFQNAWQDTCMILQHLIISYCNNGMPQNLQYKLHQIPELKCFSCRLAVVFAQSIEARC